ncbi:MAG: ABC transporter substrate-binding protein [Candidatus Omnitrophica bacterium]|nr:ABC transporter substrate-binding protein [Candidatus Omnitrophota bacterium]
MNQTATKLIRVGHSPDPDDAFMFYALAHEKIPMQGFRVEHVIEDIESLNQRALQGELEVTAVSCHAYAFLSDRYVVMRSGASIGDQYGPILVSREPVQDIRGKKIGIPGKLTTAYLVLQLYERGINPVFLPFDQILGAVQSGQVDLGLIIHEGQITYDQLGLSKIVDLGAWWYEKTRLPLPLGIDIIRRDLGRGTIQDFARLFKSSIEYALSHREPALQYAIQYGRGLREDLNDRFVGMYVNPYTVEMGEKGEAGFRRLFEEGFKQGILPKKVELEFSEF